MAVNVCGTCLYGSNRNKVGVDKVECMLEGYKLHKITDSCPKYKRDFKKNVVINYGK